jgi:hypothetical protein
MILAIMPRIRSYGVLSLYSLYSTCLFLNEDTRSWDMQGSSKTTMTVEEALDAFDREYTFVREILLPEEDRARLTGARWGGGYRWFRSPNAEGRI